MSEVDASVLRVTVVLNYTIHEGSGLGQVACAIGRVVRGLLEDALVMTRLLNNPCSRPVNVVDLRSW